MLGAMGFSPVLPQLRPSLWELLDHRRAKASPTIDFTHRIGAEHDEYVVLLSEVRPVTDGAALYVRFRQGGVWQDSGGYDRAALKVDSDDVSVSSLVSTGADQIAITTTVGAGTDNGICGEVRFSSPANTSRDKKCRFETSYITSSGLNPFVLIKGAGVLHQTAAMTGLRFLFDAGNIAAGDFALYGLRLR